MAQITYYAPAGVTSINLSDGSRAVVVDGQITVDSKFRNELEAAGCSANAKTDNAVRFTKTVTGGIELSAGLAALGYLTNEIGVKPMGCQTNNNGGAGNTFCMKIAAPGDFDAVRLVLYHNSTSAVSAYQMIVSATETAAQDTDINRWRPVVGGVEYSTLDAVDAHGWKSVKWAGASTITPAAGSATVPTISVSDWLPVSSVPRVDGSKFPLLNIRSYVSGGTCSFVGRNVLMEQPTVANGGFIVQCGYTGDTGLFVTAPATNNPVAAQSSACPVIGIQFRTRKSGISLLGVGDSITQNSGVVADALSSMGWRAAAAISALGIPCGYVNHGFASQPADVFAAAGLNALSKWGAFNAVMIQSFSPNGPNSPYSSDAIMRYTLLQQSSLVQSLVSMAKEQKTAIFLSTGVPCSVGIIPAESQDAIRRAHIAKLKLKNDVTVLDWDALVSDNAAPARIAVAYQADTTHPNEAAVVLQANQLTEKLRSVFGV